MSKVKRAVDKLTGKEDGIYVERVVTVARPADELFDYWQHFERLPLFMKHLESVKVIDARRSHWVACAPAGRTVEWDAEIVDLEENQQISWRSLEGSDVQTTGSVCFTPAPGGRGTEVLVSLRYSAPGGKVGAMLARLFGEEPSQQIAHDMRRFKMLMEAGEVATVEGQPTAHKLKQHTKTEAEPEQERADADTDTEPEQERAHAEAGAR